MHTRTLSLSLPPSFSLLPTPHPQSGDGEEVPPPLPIKQKQRRHGNMGSPQHTPTPSHSLSSPVAMHGTGYLTADSLARSFGTSSYHRGSGSSDGVEPDADRPPVPMRMESIPWVKNALVQDTPPPKPPRTDVPNTAPQVHYCTTAVEVNFTIHVGVSCNCRIELS